MKAKIFISYSHRDEAACQALQKHLSTLKRSGTIEPWTDRKILPGDEFNGKISAALETADIVLLMISPDFLASDYCSEIEMKRALERHKSGECRVIPVIVEPCDWHETEFGSLQALPTDGSPIVKFPNLNDGYLDVVKGVRSVIAELGLKNEVTDELPSLPSKSVESERIARSSNLNIRRRFTDLEKDEFLRESFNYIRRFFEESLNELGTRYSHITPKVEDIDNTCFSATVYMDGQSATKCTIWIGDLPGHQMIIYSQGSRGRGNSMNDGLRVDDNGIQLYLVPALGFFQVQHGSGNELSQEGGAEHLWSQFIRPIQN